MPPEGMPMEGNFPEANGMENHGPEGFAANGRMDEHQHPGFDHFRPMRSPAIETLIRFDKDHDFKLNEAEYADFNADLKNRLSMDKAVINGLSSADINNDKYVTFPEYELNINKVFLSNAPAFDHENALKAVAERKANFEQIKQQRHNANRPHNGENK